MSLETSSSLRTELWAVDVGNVEEQTRETEKEQPVK